MIDRDHYHTVHICPGSFMVNCLIATVDSPSPQSTITKAQTPLETSWSTVGWPVLRTYCGLLAISLWRPCLWFLCSRNYICHCGDLVCVWGLRENPFQLEYHLFLTYHHRRPSNLNFLKYVRTYSLSSNLLIYSWLESFVLCFSEFESLKKTIHYISDAIGVRALHQPLV